MQRSVAQIQIGADSHATRRWYNRCLTAPMPRLIAANQRATCRRAYAVVVGQVRRMPTQAGIVPYLKVRKGKRS